MKKKIKTKYKLIVFSVLLCCISIFVYVVGNIMDKTPTIIKLEANTSNVQVYKYSIDFEDCRYIGNSYTISADRALSGEKSSKVMGNNYSSAILIPVPTNDSDEMSDVDIRLWISPTTNVINALWVFSIVDQNNNQVHWDGFVINGESFGIDNWYSFSHRFEFPQKFVNTGYSIKAYLCNQDSANAVIYLDDVYISLRDQDVESPRSKLIDFEDYNDKSISSKYAKSGFYSTSAKGKDGFSSDVRIPLKELKISNIHSIEISFNYLSETDVLDAVFIVSICDPSHKDLLWQGVDLSKAKFEPKVWEMANVRVLIPDELAKPENYIKISVWNRSDQQVFIDDIYVVVREKTLATDSVQTSFNMITEKKFQPKANHPPYNVKFVELVEFNSVGAANLNKVFTQNSRVLIGKFDDTQAKDQLFFSNSEGHNLLYFKNDNVEINKVKFEPSLKNNTLFFADEGQLFTCDLTENKLTHYLYNKQKYIFYSVGEIKQVDGNKISAIIYNQDKTISVFQNDGNVLTYESRNGNYINVSTNKVASPRQSNLKLQKADFFNTKHQDVLLIYLENDINKYIFLSYNASTKNWKMSANNNNKSVQSYDKLDFVSEYFVIDFNDTPKSQLLQFNKNIRFDLKLIDFNKITYNILFNLEFKGFPKKQNPKYYEVSKIVCGDFVGDKGTDIIIFQDNNSKIDWLTQKTEIYSFIGL